MLLQLTLEEPRDLRMLEVLRHDIDVVEVGSTLLKRCGVSAISTVAETAPGLTVIAGSRTVDNGELEATMMFAAGAQIVTVLPSASRATQDAVQSAAERHGGWVVVDAAAGADTTAAVRPFPDRYTHIAIGIGHPLSAASERLRRLRLTVHICRARLDLESALQLNPHIIAFRASALDRRHPKGDITWIRQQLSEAAPGSPWAPR